MLGILYVVHILVTISLIALVLLQHGKGADMGLAFGSSSSSSLFGSAGSTQFMVRLTSFIAFLFFCTSIGLGLYQRQGVDVNSFIQAPAENPDKQ